VTARSGQGHPLPWKSLRLHKGETHVAHRSETGERYLKRTGQVGRFFGGEEGRREQQCVRTDRLDLQIGELCLAAVSQYEGLSEHRARLATIFGQQGAVDQDSGDVCVIDNLCGRGKKGEPAPRHTYA
jgi:hypothetical protein